MLPGEASRFLAKLKEISNPKLVSLYGSRLSSLPDALSDIDICVVLDDHYMKLADKIEELADSQKIDVSVISVSQAIREAEEGNPIIKQVIDGIVLLDTGLRRKLAEAYMEGNLPYLRSAVRGLLPKMKAISELKSLKAEAELAIEVYLLLRSLAIIEATLNGHLSSTKSALEALSIPEARSLLRELHKAWRKIRSGIKLTQDEKEILAEATRVSEEKLALWVSEVASKVYWKLAEEALKSAERNLSYGDTRIAVIASALAAVNLLKATLLRAGIQEPDLSYTTFPELLSMLDDWGISLSRELRRKLRSLQKLRNRVYHESYVPTRREAEKAISAVKEAMSELKQP
ncbi:MAG: hypothetical protein DRN96_09860 [Thermoproteota archaeon]|nr:MAG: hypothetical protein DRN96_09860 [Candidatus Korarchaeota archaeon]